MSTQKIQLFGAIAVQLGYIRPEQVEECLRLQEEYREAGATVRIGQIMYKRGFLDPDRYVEILSAQQKDKLECSVCGNSQQITSLNGKELHCGECGKHLVLPPDVKMLLGQLKEDILRDSSPPPDSSKRIQDRYLLGDKIGQGGMAQVYRAHDTKLNRSVALKFMKQLGPHQNAVRRFIREAQIIARLDHPSIVQIHDFFEESGDVIIAMQHVGGGTLQHKMNDKRMAARDAISLLVKVSDAVHFAHEEGIVHRDLKPSNILMDRSGSCFVSDFGLAKEIESEKPSNDLVGTPHYMAPEQITGGKVDRWTDVYALGVMLYEILTGRTPFSGASPAQIFHKITHERPDEPHILDPDVDRDLSAICLMAMEKDPIDRYPTAQLFAEDLRRYLEGKTVSARLPNIAERTVRHVGENKWAYVIACLMLTVAGLAAIIYMRQKQFERDLNREVEAARGYEIEADWDNAREHWVRAARLQPANGKWLSNAEECRNRIQLQALQLKTANDLIAKFVANLSTRHTSLDKFRSLLENAERNCRSVLTLSRERSAEAWFNLSRIQMLRSQPYEAHRSIERAISLNDKNRNYILKRGQIALKILVERTLSSFARWVPIDPTKVRGESKTWLERASLDLERSLEDPNLSEHTAKYIKGCLAYLKASDADTIRLLEEISTEADDAGLRTDALKLIGFMHYMKTRFKKGFEAFQKAAEERINDFEAHLWAATGMGMWSQVKRRKSELTTMEILKDAMVGFDNARTIHPDHSEGIKRHCWILQLMIDEKSRLGDADIDGELREQDKLLLKIADLEKTDPEVAFLRAGWSLMSGIRTRGREKAHEILSKGIQAARTADDLVTGKHRKRWILTMLSRLYLERAKKSLDRRDLAQALAALERILDLIPDHAMTLQNAAALAQQLGELERAIKYLRRAVRANPELGPRLRPVIQMLRRQLDRQKKAEKEKKGEGE